MVKQLSLIVSFVFLFTCATPVVAQDSKKATVPYGTYDLVKYTEEKNLCIGSSYLSPHKEGIGVYYKFTYLDKDGNQKYSVGFGHWDWVTLAKASYNKVQIHENGVRIYLSGDESQAACDCRPSGK